MQFKKNRAILSAVLAAGMASSALMSVTASAERTKPEKYGTDTYAARFMSMYNDVITNGVENGYLDEETGSPYHSVEELICEAPDYGHETTSEAMSYIVWIAAMHDNILKDKVVATEGGDDKAFLADSWKVLENMIPSATQQTGFWARSSLSAQACAEYPYDVSKYPSEGSQSNVGENPLHSKLTTAYSEGREYLLHWLADVDDWYGFSGSARGTKGKFTFINTFNRGDQESCFETIPHPSIEDMKWGNEKQGMKFAFQGSTVASWSYTNAPDAEDRAIQAVYAANRWGVGDSSVSKKAAMMGDMCRNDMYDKYYKEIGCQQMSASSSGEKGKHYLMAWYTAWGGAADSTWAWQIGCSHAHQFYQNPLAAFGLLYGDGLKGGMTAADADKDYEESLKRQLEMYLWLSSAQGPFAGGCTNCWNGDYETYPSDVPQFYKMAYIEQPVYADPGSNNWTGNQYWATQRLAELYYIVKTDPAAASACSGVKPGGMSVEEALKTVLDKWVKFFLSETTLTDDGDFKVPASLKWSGAPNDWDKTGKYSDNSGLTCSVSNYQNTDLGCVCSYANLLTYYAKANGVEAKGAVEDDPSDQAKHALYVAQQLMDRTWKLGRDDIGLTRVDHNGSLARFWAQEVYIPEGVSGKYPYGTEPVTHGAKFIDLRPQYADAGQSYSDLYAELKAAYDKDVAGGAAIKEYKYDPSTYKYGMDCATDSSAFKNVEKVDLKYHRFWHAGDILMALGTMHELYPEVTPTDASSDKPPVGEFDWGNVDLENKVDVSDAVLLAKYNAGIDDVVIDDQGLLNADVNESTKPDPEDLTIILQYIVGLVEYGAKAPAAG